MIYKKEGFRGYWKGLNACVYRAFYANSIGFVVYEYMKKVLKEDEMIEIEKLHSHWMD